MSTISSTSNDGAAGSAAAASDLQFIWPLGNSPAPDEMNTSFGPRIDADRWDFHDGIDLPAPAGTLIHALSNGTVHRAGPADQGFGSTHVILKVRDPTDGQDDLFVVHLHLDSIADGVIPGAEVRQGDVIGAVGQEDATYTHLHFEFRKGGTEQRRSVHPLHYLPYLNTANFGQFRLDRINFYRDNGDKRMVRLCFDIRSRQEGDLQAVQLKFTGKGVAARTFRVDFDDRATINSSKGDEQEFKKGIAVEGYQKSNLKGEGFDDLHYGVLVRDIAPEFETVRIRVQDVRNEKPGAAEFRIPKLGANGQLVDSRVDFEDQTFPPQGWELQLLPGNICRTDAAAALAGLRGLLCQDLQSLPGTMLRAGLRFALPPDRLSWRIGADIKLAELTIDEGAAIQPLAFLAGEDLVAAACLRKIGDNHFAAGVVIRTLDGLLREKLDVDGGIIGPNDQVRWDLDLIRLGTRQTTAVLRLNNTVVTRVNGDTARVEPDTGCVGILHRHSGSQITLHADQLLLTEAPR